MMLRCSEHDEVKDFELFSKALYISYSAWLPVDLFIQSQISSIVGTPLEELRDARASKLGIFKAGIQLGRARERNLERGRSLYNQALHHGLGGLDHSVSRREGSISSEYSQPIDP